MDNLKFQDFKMLVFKVGREEYGIQISNVVSIERMNSISIYPNMPPHVLGVTSIRNIVMPVVDLRSALTGKLLPPTETTRLILVNVREREIGLVVDTATEVLDIAPDMIQHPNLLETKDVTFLQGISKIGDRLLILLDIEELLQDTTNLDALKDMIDSFKNEES
ncbi:chemotaxis protein CheW [Neobacillus ginsengisoli]|uniref:Purine-binding chemotaxis protein CheW n=1 Tax=Neobacillus ginsengisoli TaxID=904295 RepID=A0ABT9XVJ4_9BACI|nr:chemotaxis protein CheW [Neobacillus ginsengisoli]MDQ0199578.1 purine-binding chemotaxis protein CheW [Neobacillus ginsengisoli]